MISRTILCTILVLIPAAVSAQYLAHDASADPRYIGAEFEYGNTITALGEDGTGPLYTTESRPVRESKKSAFLAGVLSAAVPGAGDIYAENYIMAGVFMVAEAIGWYYHIDQNSKGDDQTDVYQAYADNHWSAVKYAQFLNEHANKFDGGEGAPQIPINPDVTLPPWERVDWATMNEVELMIPVFSHRLPVHGAQQYFELIGKYHQYTYGWDDKQVQGDVTIDYRNISPNFEYYSKERGKANDFYNTATTITNLIILNHVLAAANAIWSVSRFNQRVELYSHVELLRVGPARVEAVPTATFKFKLP